jgi:hypothetical protein
MTTITRSYHSEFDFDVALRHANEYGLEGYTLSNSVDNGDTIEITYEKQGVVDDIATTQTDVGLSAQTPEGVQVSVPS